MRTACILLLSLLLALPLAALDDAHAIYLGGTVPNLKEGAIGRLDTTSPEALIFESAGNKLAVPYSQIVSHEYSEPVTHHLGVLPAIAVVLLVHRQHRHIFRITYRSTGSAPEVLILEVSKDMSRPLFAVLEARAPRPCSNRPRCGNLLPSPVPD